MTTLIRQRRISLFILSFILWSVSPAVSQVTFSGPTNYTAGNTPYTVAAGDFNGDGKVDMAVPNFGSNNISILLGTGAGAFGAATNFAVGTGPQYAAVGDFNGDGKLDLATANWSSNNVSILLGKGDGTFQAAVNYAAGTNPRDVVVADLNGDGKLDLVVTNNGDTTVSVFLGNGDGTFKPQVTYTVGNSPRAVVVADFNKDGKLDLAVTNTNDNTVSVLLGNGDGTFRPQVTYATGNAPWFLAVGDFNADGNLDLAIPNNTDNNVSILLGRGDGTFQAQTTYAAGTGAHTIGIYDFNGDGILDLVVANNGSNNISLLLGNGNGSFQAPTNFTVGNGPKGMYMGDLSGDGRADIATANTGASNNVSVLLNTTPSFPTMTLTGPANTTAGAPFSVTVTLKSSGVTYAAYRGTVHFTSSDIQAGLPSNYTFTAADAGVHTFTNLVTLKTAGSQTVTTTDTLNSYDTGTITVAVGPAAASVFTVTAPANATAGTPFNVTVTAKDIYGNIATGYTGTVHFTSTDGQSVLPANYTFVAGDNGVHVFSVTLKTAANQTVTATDTVTGSITGTSGAVATAPAAASQFTVTAPASSSAGAAFSVTVTAKDPYGNIATGYRGTAHFTSSDGQAVLPANYTFTAGDNGVHTFTNLTTLKTSGNQTVTATDTVTGSITGFATVNVTFAAAGATKLGVTAPANATAGTAFNVTVTAQDQFGNTVTNYTGTVHFTSSDGAAVLPANYTFVAGDNGAHTFASGVTLKTAGSRTVTATDTVTGSITGFATITVAAAGATHYTVATSLSSVAAGTAMSVTVTALDQFNNTATGYTGTVHFTSSDAQAVLPANYTFVAGDNGVHTFTNLLTFKTAGSQTVTATDTVTGSITGTSPAVTVTFAAGGTTKLQVTAPATSAAGSAFSVTVTAQDQFGNTVTNYTGTVHFTTSDGQGTVPANYTFVAGDNGVHTFANGVTLKTAGSQTVTATDTVTGSITGFATVNVTFAAGGATKFQVTAPASSAAGSAFNITVTAQDQFGNTVTNYVGTVHFTSSDGQAVLPANYTFVAGDNGVHTFANGVTLKTAGSRTVTATDTVTGSITGFATVNVTFAAGGATQLSVTAPATSAAGSAFNITVTAQDQYGNTVTNYTGTVHFTTSDGQGTVPANYTFVAGDNGVHAFVNGVTLKTAGSRTVTATDMVTGSITGFATVNVTFAAGGATKLLVTAPASSSAGAAFNVTVTAQDQYGNTVTNYNGTVTFTSSDGQAVLPANYTFIAGDNGAHTFVNGVTLKTSGNQTVTATDASSRTGSATVAVTFASGGATKFVITVPANATAGAPFNITVTAEDQYGNPVPNYTGTVHFTSTDGQSVLPADYTFVAGDNGSHTFSVTLKTAGNETITATDTSSGATGTSSAVPTSPAASTQLVVSAPASSSAGAAFNVTVTAKDAYGNTATGYRGTVQFSSSDVQALLPANYTFVAADNGVHTFVNGVTLKTAGNKTVTATDTVTATITGSATVNVTSAAGGATKLLVTAPATSAAGSAFNVTVTAQDQFGNTVTSYTGTVHFTTSDGQGTVPANYTFVAGDNGVHTFVNGVTLKTAGSQTVTATDTVTASITGFATVNVTFAAGGATKLQVTAPATSAAGNAFNVTVTAQDQFGNTVTNYTGTVHFTTSDGQGTVPANYTFVAGDNGVHTFVNGVTLKTAGTQTVTATDTVTGSIAGSATVNVTSAIGGVTKLQVTAPATSAAGSAFNVTVTAQDQFGNTVTSYTGTVRFTTSDGQGTLPANYTFVAGDNGVHIFVNGVTLKTAGSQTVTATDTVTGSITGSATVNVTSAAGGATKLQVTAPATSAAGSAFNVTVTAQDQFGNTVTNYTGTVQFTTSDGQGTVPANYTFVAGDNGVHTFVNGVTLKTAGSQTVTATDTVTASITGSATVNVTFAAGGATKLLVTAPATSAAGNAFNVTVTAQDQFGNTVTNYTGTVHFTTSDGQGTVPANYIFVAGDNGVHTFVNGVTLKTAGSQTVTATDTVTASITGFATVNVTFAAGGATKLQVIAPANATAGSTFNVTVTAQDQFGNTVTNYTGTVHFTTSDAQATVPANYTFVAGDNGAHVFANVMLKTAGSQTITATDTVTASITGFATVNVSATTGATQLSVTAPANATAGTAFNVTVTAQDQFGNTITTYTGTVHFTSNDGAASLPANYTFVAGDNGVHTFTNGVTLNTAGNKTVVATDTVTGSITGTATVAVKNSTTTAVVSSANPSLSGSSVTFTATVTPGSAAGTVTFFDGGINIGSSALSGGVATFATASLTLGNHTITAVYGGDSNDLGSTSPVLIQNVKANSTSSVVSSVNPSVFGQSVTFTATVTGLPPANSTPSGTVTFKDGAATLGTGTLSGSGVSAQATYTTSALLVSGHSITAVYGGDFTYFTSTSPVLTQTVNQAATTTTITNSSLNPSTFGQSVTFTASVVAVAPGAGTPTGTVTFKDGATTLGTSAVNGSGIATLATSAVVAGNRNITAVYSGDAGFAGSTSPNFAQQVNQSSTSTTLTTSTSSSVFGQPVTLTATIVAVAPGSGVPTGTVQFMDGASPLGAPAAVNGSGQATLVTTSLALGAHPISADYAGDTNFIASNSSTQVVSVSQASSSAAVSSSVNPSIYGQPVTFTAVITPVAPSTGIPTGTVTFKDGGVSFAGGTVALDNTGQATLTPAPLSVGSHNITIVYSGDTNYGGSNGALPTQTVNQASTTTSVSSSANPSAFGQSVTFTATVAAVAPGAGTPTGTVTFFDGATNIGTGTLSSGVATFAASALTVGNHTITANYGGDVNFTSSTGPLNGNPQVVGQGTTTTAVTSSANASVFGQTVDFIATVTPSTATGNVTFMDGATTLGTVSLTSGSATFAISAMAVGNHTITVVYAGDSNFTGSTGSLTGNPQVVNQAGTRTAVVSSVNPSNANQSVTFTATVAPIAPGAGLPTGSVQFMDGGSPLGAPVNLNGSAQATYTTTTLSVGSHPITAVYGGDGSFTGSTSPALNQTVQGADIAVTMMHSPDPVALGGKLTFTATVINNGPSSANVTFTESFVGANYVVSTSSTMGSCSGTGPVNCNLGLMTNGQTAMVTIVLTPIHLTRTIVATATANGDVADSNLTNNNATDTANVRFRPFAR